MENALIKQINALSLSEKILLVEEIWDSIAIENESFELTQTQQDQLDRRIKSYNENPNQGRSWEEIKSEFLKKKPVN
ncbi:MAG: addiction module protein [Ignavibacteriaceae bacterium]|jgi:putative addiction module component (TIGR02574 family)